MLSDFSSKLRKINAAHKFEVLGLVTILGFSLYLVPPYVTAFLVAIGIGLFGVGAAQAEVWFDTTAAIFTFTFITEVIVVVALLYLLKFLRQSWKDIGVVKPKLRDLGFMLAGFGVYLVTYMVVANVLQGTLDFEQRQELGFNTEVYGINLWLVFISLVVLPPLVEEILFRGFLYTQLRRAFNVLWAAILISLLFGAAHLQVGSGNPLLWVAAVDTFILSLVLVYLREKTGSIWAGVGVHALKNFVAFIILFVLKIA